MKTLTKRQKELFDFIKEFIKANKYPPTIREIASRFEISVKGAHDHLKALRKKGYVRCNTNRSRAIEIIKDMDDDGFLTIPVLGNVAAGVPLFAEENFERVIKLPSSSMKAGKYFALHVRGDSMQDAGILDGDTAIFVQKSTAENGDIVVARINDESVTLKRFYREKNRFKLKAENPVYPPIYTQTVKIIGKLQCIMRNYD